MVENEKEQSLSPHGNNRGTDSEHAPSACAVESGSDAAASGSGPLFFLLDGAASQAHGIGDEMDTQKRVAADRSCPLAERLEAFEDIMESEVGDTPLSRSISSSRGGTPREPRKTALLLPSLWTRCAAGSTPSPWPRAETTVRPSAWPRPWPVWTA